MKRWKKEEEKLLLELFEDGSSALEIAKKLNRTRQSVYRKLKTCGQKKIYTRSWTHNEDHFLMAHYSTLTAKQIASRLPECSTAQVYDRGAKLGITKSYFKKENRLGDTYTAKEDYRIINFFYNKSDSWLEKSLHRPFKYIFKRAGQLGILEAEKLKKREFRGRFDFDFFHRDTQEKYYLLGLLSKDLWANQPIKVIGILGTEIVQVIGAERFLDQDFYLAEPYILNFLFNQLKKYIEDEKTFKKYFRFFLLGALDGTGKDDRNLVLKPLSWATECLAELKIDFAVGNQAEISIEKNYRLGALYLGSKLHNLEHQDIFLNPRYTQDIDKRKKYFRNDRFFSTWSAEMAYVLGWAAGDGFICRHSKNSFKFGIAVNKKDQYILHKILGSLKTNQKPRSTQKNMVEFRISSKQITSDLMDFGITPNKSKTLKLAKEIPQDYIGPFLLGLLDSDGAVSINTSSKSISIFTASKDFSQQIKELFEKININAKIYRPKTDYYAIRFFTQEDIKKLFDFYAELPYYLWRKYKKMETLNDPQKP